MPVNEINGKVLRRSQYDLLADLGIEIVLYDLKLHQTNYHTMYLFEIKGSLSTDFDFDKTHELLVLLKGASESESPAILDALDQLKLVIGITDESK